MVIITYGIHLVVFLGCDVFVDLASCVDHSILCEHHFWCQVPHLDRFVSAEEQDIWLGPGHCVVHHSTTSAPGKGELFSLVESQLFGLRLPFWSKNWISMAPGGKLIIDQEIILKTFSFHYSYDWRAGKFIIDLGNLFPARGNVFPHCKNVSANLATPVPTFPVESQPGLKDF